MEGGVMERTITFPPPRKNIRVAAAVAVVKIPKIRLQYREVTVVRVLFL
jgi:hypothetical protein